MRSPADHHPCRMSLFFAIFLTVTLWAVSPLSSQDPTPPPPPEGATAETSPADAGSPDASSEEASPSDEAGDAAAGETEEERVWLVDERNREYYIEVIPKKDFGAYTRVDEGSIRTKHGLRYMIAGEDEENFYVKFYNTKKIKIAKRGPGEPKAEALAEVAQEYEVEEIPSADVLEVSNFGEGLPASGMWRHGFGLGDMNGDGHTDIVHGPARKSGTGPQIFLGNGAGSWQLWEAATFPDLTYDYGDAAVADFNRDGHDDFALGMHFRGVVVLVNDGQGHFKTWTDGIKLMGLDAGRRPLLTTRRIDTLDWNRDSWPDIIALSEGPPSLEQVGKPGTSGKVLYLNQRDGTWNKRSDGAKTFGDDIVVTDLNSDGKVDFLTASSVGGDRDLINLHQDDGSWKAISLDVVRPSAWVSAIEVADLDGDERQEIILSYVNIVLGVYRNGVDVLYPQDDGSWKRRVLRAIEGRGQDSAVHTMASGDLDLDGHTDLVFSEADGEVFIFRGDGKGFFLHEEEAGLKVSRPACRGYDIAIADVSGDGRPEIIASFAGEDCQPAGGSLHVWQTKAR